MKRLFVLFGMIVPALAWAGGEFDDATQLFRKQEYGKVQQTAERVLKSAEAGPKELVEAYRWQGLALAAQGKTAEAVQAFRRLLAIEPGYKLPKGTSPKLTAPFFQAAGMARDSGGILLLHQPPEAGKSLGGQVLEVAVKTDPLGMIKTMRLRYWTAGGAPELVVQPINGPGKVGFQLPLGFDAKEASYSFEALNEAGGVLAQAGGAGNVFHLQVKTEAVAAPPWVAPAGGGTTPPAKLNLDQPVSKQPEPVATTTDNDSGEKKSSRATPWYKTWWFWTVVGVAVAGAAAGTTVALLSAGGDSDTMMYKIQFK
jgi:hypothetical protein